MWGVPDLILSGGFTSIPDDTLFPIPFIDYATPHTQDSTSVPITISDEDGELFILEITDDDDPGNDRWEVESRREGWWAADLITQWAQINTGGGDEFGYAMQRITWTDVTGFAFDPTEFRIAADWMDADLHPNFEMTGSSYLHTWMAPNYVPSGKTWQMDARQVTGTARDLSGMSMKWWFIEADDLDAWTFGSV